MSADKNDFPMSLSETFKGAYSAANPVLKEELGQIGTEFSYKMLKDLSAHFRAAVEMSGDLRVFGVLPPVPEPADQIALDRKQFPVLDDAARANTEKLLDTSKEIARGLIRNVRDGASLGDADKLMLIEYARMYIASALVYHDRLENTKPKAPAKGMTP